MSLNASVLIGRPFQYDGEEYYVLGSANYDYDLKMWFAYYDGVFDIKKKETGERINTDDKARFLKESPFYESMLGKASAAFTEGVRDYIKSITVKD